MTQRLLPNALALALVVCPQRCVDPRNTYNQLRQYFRIPPERLVEQVAAWIKAR